jgi:uncharacterized repeat protein (TIGR01451 family)
MAIATSRARLAWTILATVAATVGCQNHQVVEPYVAKEQHAPPAEVIDQEPPGDDAVAEEREAGYRGVELPALADSARVLEVRPEMPKEIRVGSQYTYRIHVANTSSTLTLHDVRVQQKLPQGVQIESSTPAMQSGQSHSAGAGQSGQQNQAGQQNQQQQQNQTRTAAWKFDSLGPGETKTIEVTAFAEHQGEAQTCFTSSYQAANCVALRFVKPEIELTKRAPDKVNLCENFELVYQITNTGTAPTKELTLTDSLPDALRTTEGEQKVTFQVPALEAGESRKFTAHVTASKTGQFGSRAAVALEEGKKIRSNKPNIQIVAADLQIEAQGPEASYLDRPIDYTITVTNQGSAPAPATRLSFDPAGAAYVVYSGQPRRVQTAGQSSAAPPQPQPARQNKPEAEANVAVNEVAVAGQEDLGPLAWNLGTLRPGESKRVSVTLRGAEQGMLESRAVAVYACPLEKEGAKTRAATTVDTRIIALPALLVSVIDDQDPVPVGEELTYRVIIANEGQAADHNIKASVKLPVKLEFVKATGDSPADVKEGQLTFEPIESLAPGDRAEWKVRVKAKQAGEVRFPVQLTSDGSKEPILAEEPTRLFQPESPQAAQGQDQQAKEKQKTQKQEQAQKKEQGKEKGQTQKKNRDQQAQPPEPGSAGSDDHRGQSRDRQGQPPEPR